MRFPRFSKKNERTELMQNRTGRIVAFLSSGEDWYLDAPLTGKEPDFIERVEGVLRHQHGRAFSGIRVIGGHRVS